MGKRYLFTLGMLLWAFLRGKWVSFSARIVVVGVSAREMGIFSRLECCCWAFLRGKEVSFHAWNVVVEVSAREMGIFLCAECCSWRFCAGNGYLFARGLLLRRFLRGKWVSFSARIVVVGVSAREMGIFLRSDCCYGGFCAGNGYLFALGLLLWAFLRGKWVSFCARKGKYQLPAREIALFSARIARCHYSAREKGIILCSENSGEKN